MGAHAGEAPTAELLAGRRVLLVTDNVATSEILAGRIRAAGATVVEAVLPLDGTLSDVASRLTGVLAGSRFDGAMIVTETSHRDALLDTRWSTWERAMRSGLSAVFVALREVGVRMAAAERGTIVVATSVRAIGGVPGYAAYASVQGGRLALIATAAKELAPLGVRVNGVALGHAPGEDRLSDAADLAAYLLSDAADGLVGEVLAPITDNER